MTAPLDTGSWPSRATRMAKPRFKRVCRHCHKPFIPDWRNRHRQFYCRKPACRKARKAASQRRWHARNPDHFKHPKHAERVRLWRERRRRRTAHAPLTDACIEAREPVTDDSNPRGGEREPAVSAPLLQDRFEALQDFIVRNPFVLALLRHLFGCSLKDDIEAKVRELVEMGAQVQRGFSGGGGP
jgi:hypothetical protein